MVVSQWIRYFAAAIVGVVVFIIALTIAREGYPWGSWHSDRRYARKALELAQANINAYVQQHGQPPQTLLEVYGSENELPRDVWNRKLIYRLTEEGYELMSLGSDGRPGGFGNETDLTLDREWKDVTLPTVSEFLLHCVTTEIWLTAAVTALLAAGMLIWTTTAARTPRLTILHFLLAFAVTLAVSYVVGGVLMLTKIGPRH